MPQMQTLGDAEATLGFLFGMVGLGCFLGPLGMNLVSEPEGMGTERKLALPTARQSQLLAAQVGRQARETSTPSPLASQLMPPRPAPLLCGTLPSSACRTTCSWSA